MLKAIAVVLMVAGCSGSAESAVAPMAWVDDADAGEAPDALDTPMHDSAAGNTPNQDVRLFDAATGDTGADIDGGHADAYAENDSAFADTAQDTDADTGDADIAIVSDAGTEAGTLMPEAAVDAPDLPACPSEEDVCYGVPQACGLVVHPCGRAYDCGPMCTGSTQCNDNGRPNVCGDECFNMMNSASGMTNVTAYCAPYVLNADWGVYKPGCTHPQRTITATPFDPRQHCVANPDGWLCCSEWIPTAGTDAGGGE